MSVVHNITMCPRALFEWAAANSNLQVLETVFPYEDRETLELLMRNPQLSATPHNHLVTYDTCHSNLRSLAFRRGSNATC